MNESLPTGDLVIFGFCELLAIGFACEFAAQFMQRNFTSAAIAFCITLTLFITGIKWPAIKTKIKTPVASKIERMAGNRRIQITAFLLIVCYFTAQGMLYVLKLRSDLDIYAMPRVVTETQAAKIREVLSSNNSDIRVYVLVNSGNAEAMQYAEELNSAIASGGWKPYFMPLNPWAPTPQGLEKGFSSITLATDTAGLSISYCTVVGQSTEPNPKHPAPHETLIAAFNAAKLQFANDARANCDTYSLSVEVSRRPVAINQQLPVRARIVKWLMSHN